MLTYGSVCSGIESASVAWIQLGFKAEWLAEVEPFPCAVLAYRYPEIPNLGDMTRLAGLVLSGKIDAPDVLIGGTPCQAFSIAGMREGLTDERGALTIKYVELADAIDLIRARAGKPAAIAIWENVPGVLADKGNAFGCFLGALAGENSELQPSGKTWPNAGCVYGPQRTVAWRVLDAQYFGLAQRRRRVFVVASARAGFDPNEVLFEREGVRRDTPPSREAGEETTVCPTLRAGGNSTGGTRPPGTDVDTADSLQVVSIHGSQDPDVKINLAHTLGRNSGQENAISCMAHGQGRAEVAHDRSPTLTCIHEAPIISAPVRRLTPRECERLQGFPDDYTAIPWRGKPAEKCPDGPRYKAIGNSKAVPVVRWLGRRLLAVIETGWQQPELVEAVGLLRRAKGYVTKYPSIGAQALSTDIAEFLAGKGE